MNIAEIHEVLGENRALIASTWEYFVTVHLSLFGLMFLINPQRITVISRVIMLAAYCGFMFINYRAQVDNYAYALELIRIGTEAELAIDVNSRVISKVFKPGWLIEFLPLIYGVAAALGGLLILTPHKHAIIIETKETL